MEYFGYRNTFCRSKGYAIKSVPLYLFNLPSFEGAYIY